VERTDAQILADLKERFDILATLTKGAVAKNVRAVTVTGAPGVGKTYTVEQILENAKEQKNITFEIIRGAISAVNLYKAAYRNRKAGSVIVLDDADSIFNDEDALNILKVLCDSSDVRRVSWLKESQALVSEDVPQTFEFNGAMIFISNLDFQQFVDEGRNKYSQHFEALMSRSLYLDLRLHGRNELGVWIEHVAQSGNIFRREGLTEAQGTAVLSFLRTNRDTLRELSLRTLLKTSQLVKTQSNWEKMAKILLTK
jgi:predicted AAA+ superfamily ATPase